MPDIRIERGAPDDLEIAALVAALAAVAATGSTTTDHTGSEPATVAWLRPAVLVPAADWTATASTTVNRAA